MQLGGGNGFFSELDHRKRCINANDGTSGECSDKPDRNIRWAASEVYNVARQEFWKSPTKFINEILVLFRKISLSVGLRLFGIVHEFWLKHPFHVTGLSRVRV